MKLTLVTLLVSSFLLTSCLSPPRAPSKNEVISLAREKVIKELPLLDEMALSQIRTKEPVVKRKTVDWYLDYEITWQVISNRIVMVKGAWSDREQLKYSRVQVQSADGTTD